MQNARVANVAQFSKRRKTKQKIVHIQAPGHMSLDVEIKICKSGKSCKSGKCFKSSERQKWQKLQNVATMQNKAQDSAYTSSRTYFSSFGDKDPQKWQHPQTLQKLQRQKRRQLKKLQKMQKCKTNKRQCIYKLQDIFL